jgi:tetratricopeptide (TPR) repeat protein
MGDREKEFAKVPHGLEPSVSFVDEKTFLSIRNQTIAPGIIVEQADLELVDTTVAVHELVARGELAHQATRLLRLSFSIDLGQLSENLSKALLSQDGVLDSLRFHVENSRLSLEASAGDTVVAAQVTCSSAPDGRLRLIIDEELWYGPMCLRSLPREIFELIGSQSMQPELPCVSNEMTAPCEISIDVVQPLTWALFPGHGWKLPLYRALSVTQIDLEASGRIRIHAMSDLAPRRLYVSDNLGDKQQAITLTTLARQDTIKSVPAGTYMLNHPDYSQACEQLYASLPARPSAALVERMLWVGLANPSFAEKCEALLSRELAIRPNSVPCLLVRAQLSWRRGDVRRAADDYLEIANRLQRSRASAHAYRHAALAVAEVDPERSLNYLEYAISLAPDQIGIQLDFAQAQAENGQHGRAVEMLEVLASSEMLRPSLRASVLVQAGEWFAFELDDLAAAQRSYDQALELVPEHPDALLGLAQLLERRGDSQRAALIFERLLTEALEAEDHNRASTLCMFLGDMWKESDPDAAFQRYQEAFELDSENEGARLRLVEMDYFYSAEPMDMSEIILAAAGAHQARSSSTSDATLAPGFVAEMSAQDTVPVETPTLATVTPTQADALRPSRAVTSSESEDLDRIETLIEIVLIGIRDEQAIEKTCDVLEELMQCGSETDQDKAYAAVRDLCEAQGRLDEYEQILSHRMSKVSSPPHLARIRVELGRWLECTVQDLSGAETEYVGALRDDPSCEDAKHHLKSLLFAQDRFEDILDEFGQDVLQDRLEELLRQAPLDSERAMRAARVFASTIDGSERGQFFLSTSSRLHDIKYRCEAIFEASHYEDVTRSQLLDLLASFETKDSTENRTAVLRTCLSLEENKERRVELRMALGECLTSQESAKNRAPYETPSKPKITTDEAFESLDESTHAIAAQQISGLLSQEQLDHLEARAQRLFDEGNLSRALGPSLIVRAARPKSALPSPSFPELSSPITDELFMGLLSAEELSSPFGRLLFASSNALAQALPRQAENARIEMDETGSEEGLQEIFHRVRSCLDLKFRVLVDLDSTELLEPIVSMPPGVSLSANMLKEATEPELLFEIARCMTYIKLGGLLYVHDHERHNLSGWVELLYWVLEEDVLDRIPYEFASFVEPIRSGLSTVERNELSNIRKGYSYEEVVSEAAAWPRIAQRVSARTALLMTRSLSVAFVCLAKEDSNLTEDLLDFLLGETFVGLIDIFSDD